MHDFDIALEIIRSFFLLVLLVFLHKEGKRRKEITRDGWSWIYAGLCLLLFGSLMDLSDEFPSLSRFVIVGETQVQGILEKVVGFLGGFALLTLGLTRWIPTIDKIESIREKLEKQVEGRTAGAPRTTVG